MPRATSLIKIVALLLGAGFLIFVGWLSISLVWYPSYEDLDIERLEREADTVLAKCEARHSNNKLFPIIEGDTPTIQNLVGKHQQHKCEDGLYLVLWRDYFVSSAGLFIVKTDTEPPEWIAPLATHLGGRVYSWHGGE